MRGIVSLALMGLIAMASCSSGDWQQDEQEPGETQARIIGGTAVHGPRPDVLGSVGRICSSRSCCTGTLAERPDKVLFAAHCVCSGGSNWEFQLPGRLDLPASEIGLDATCITNPIDPNDPGNARCFSGTAVAHPDFDCSERMKSAGSDLAVVTLATPVPASLATPARVYLGQNWRDFDGGLGMASGFGNFSQDDAFCGDPTPPAATEFVRRAWANCDDHGGLLRTCEPGFIVREEFDPCGGLIEGPCVHRPFWYTQYGSPTRTGKGDSGGPLIMRRGGADWVVGALFGKKCTEPLAANSTIQQVWAMTSDPERPGIAALGYNRVWLANALDLPQTLSGAQVLTEAAVFGSRGVKLNDRASVINDGGHGSIVVATDRNSLVEIRPEAETRDIYGGGAVTVLDRANVAGIVWASRYSQAASATVSGSVHTDTVIRIPDVLDGVTLKQVSTGTTDLKFEPPSTPGVNVYSPGPGHYRDVSIKRDTRLYLAPGVYVFRDFIADTGSSMQFATGPNPTYVVVTRVFMWRGRVVGDGYGFLGARTGGFINGFFQGTVVAPGARITVDTPGDEPAMFGSIFAQDVEIHQGKQIKHVPFTASWTPALQ